MLLHHAKADIFFLSHKQQKAESTLVAEYMLKWFTCSQIVTQLTIITMPSVE